MSIESFFVDITGSAAGLVKAAGEGEAAAGSLESRLGNVSGGMGGIGKAAESEIGGKGVKNVSLLDKAFGHVGNSIKGALGGMLSMVGQTAGIGALFGGAAGLAEGVKLAQQYNEQMGLLAQAYKTAGAAMPTAQIDSMQGAMTKLGFTEDASNAALLKLAQAHIPVNQQMQAMSVAADLARGKNLDLASAMNLLLMATQGTGRGLQTLGINLPAVLPKQAALNSATAALTKAQQAYNLALDKYGEYNAKTITAHDKLAAATLKVTTDTKDMANHFAALPGVMSSIESRVGGAAKSYVAANPFATMGADLQTVARVAGEALLPGLDNIAKWISGHESQIESFATQAIGGLATAAQDAGSFIANDLYPPVKDVVGFIVDHKTVFEAFAGTLTAIWAGAKIKTAAGSVLGDLKTLLSGNVAGNLLHAITGLGSSSSSGGVLGAASSAAGQRVFVTNWEMMGGGGAGGGAVNAVEGAAGGGSIAAGVTVAAGAVVAGGVLFDFYNILTGGKSPKGEGVGGGGAGTGRGGPNNWRNTALLREEDDRLAKLKLYNDAIKRGTDTAEQDMHDLHQAETAEIRAVQNATADAIRAAGLIQGIIADARAVGTSLAYNQTGSIIKQALAGGNGINTASVAPNGGGNGTSTYVAKIEINGAQSPQATAQEVRNQLLTLNRAGAIPSIFGGR